MGYAQTAIELVAFSLALRHCRAGQVGGWGRIWVAAMGRKQTSADSPNGGYSVNDIDVKIPRSVTHSISYNLRGLLEFLYLYKRT
jgi:hypothetical protein